MEIQELVQGIHDCECGHDHVCPMDYVEIGEGVLQKLPMMTEKYRKILMVADVNTDRVCGKEVYDILKDKVSHYVILQDNGASVVVPNEEKIDEILSYYTDEDLILGVGSGVINDLCKYTSNEKKIPYYIVATAPSMDGYASTGAAMILRGMKVTTPAVPPKAIIAESKVIQNAPFEMIQAGYGDIIGKFSCLNDWKLSHLINDEYFCQKVYDLTYDTTVRVRRLAKDILKRDGEAITELMKALVVVGIAMSYVGTSRPASGSEHHFSHFFEITGILTGKPYFPHGIDVVYSAVKTCELRERIAKVSPKKTPFDRATWEKEIRRIYLGSADGVIALQNKLGWYEEDKEEKIKKLWPEILAILKDCPTGAEMLSIVEEIGLPYNRFVEMYGEEKIEDAYRYAKDLKDRYSVLWLWDQYAKEA